MLKWPHNRPVYRLCNFRIILLIEMRLKLFSEYSIWLSNIPQRNPDLGIYFLQLKDTGKDEGCIRFFNDLFIMKEIRCDSAVR